MSIDTCNPADLTQTNMLHQVSSETLVQLLEGVADWVWQMNADCQFVYSNSRVHHILGFTVEEILGTTRFDFMRPEDVRDVREVFEQITRRAEPLQGFEYRMQRKDGAVVILECSAQPIMNHAGELQGYRGIDRDITRAKSYEAQREQLIIQLGQAVAEVKTLSGMLPICASCKKIRDDQGYWQHLEKYISLHSQAQFSHGLCPDCLSRLYGREIDLS